MKKLLYILPFAFLAAVSCKEDTLDVYHGDNYIHFTPGLDNAPYAEYNFALDGKTTAETAADVPVEIRIWGYLPETDIRCNVSVKADATTAKPSDYEVTEQTVFRKGHHVDTLWVKVKRNEKLLNTDFKVSVVMTSADNSYLVGPAIYNTATVRVRDFIEKQPSWWSTTQFLGDYSHLKYRLFNIFSGRVVLSIDRYSQIEFKQVALDFRQWLMEEWQKGNKYYADDNTTPLYDTIPE